MSDKLEVVCRFQRCVDSDFCSFQALLITFSTDQNEITCKDKIQQC